MKKKLVCALLVGALIGTVSLSGCKAPTEEVLPAPTVTPTVTGEESPVQMLTGRAGDAPYLTCGSLTATTEDYLEAVRDVGNALLRTSAIKGVSFREYPLQPTLSALFGQDFFTGDPVYHWDCTVDGVPFDRYLAQRARVLAFYRSWSQSELAPIPTQEGFRAWTEEQEATNGYLRFYFLLATEEEAQLLLEELTQEESSLNEMMATEYAGPAEDFLPQVVQALAEADGTWAVVEYGIGEDETVYFALIKALPLTMEDYHSALLEEAWPTAIDESQIHLADGAEELNTPQLYEDWYIWIIEKEHSIVLDYPSRARLPDDAVIAPPKETDHPSQQGQNI